MKISQSTLLAVAVASLWTPLSAAGIVFGPIKAQPGQSIRLITHSETPGGTIQRSYAGRSSNGTINITRDRELIWTFREPAADGTRRGMVRVPNITTSSVIKINGKEENQRPKPAQWQDVRHVQGPHGRLEIRTRRHRAPHPDPQ